MNRRLRFCAITLSGWLAISVSWSAENPASPLVAFGDVVLGIPRQADAERATCEAMLADGLASRMWNAEEMRAAEDWLSYVFSDAGQGESVPDWVRPGREIGWRRLVPLAARQTDPTAATEPVFLWLKSRMAVLELTRSTVLERIYRIAIEQSESAWLSAKSAADLEPAMRGLHEAKAAVGFKWGQLSRSQGYGYFPDPPGPPFRARGIPEDEWDFKDCWSIVASPEPLLLPDPVADPAGFAKARQTWQALVKGSQRFLKRPAIARRFAELDDRFRAEFSDIQQQLNAAILRDAPAAEFEREFKRLQSHVIAANPPARPPAFRPPQSPQSDTPPDYRDALRNPQPGSPPGPPPETELRWNGNYAGWLEWRQAVEAGDAKRIETARKALLAKAGEFQPRVAAYLAKRLAPPARPLPPPPATTAEEIAPKTAAVAELVAALRQRAAENPDANVSKLIQTWLKFDRGDSATVSKEMHFAPLWSAIAAGTDGRALLELRDRAARGALARLVPELAGATGTPLVPLFRKALEISIAREHHDLAGQILDLDTIASVFPDSDRAAWNDTMARWKQAADAASARSAWIPLLHTTISPAAAALAVEKIKANIVKPR